MSRWTTRKYVVASIAGVGLVASAMGAWFLLDGRGGHRGPGPTSGGSTDDSSTPTSIGRLIDESEVVLLAGMLEPPRIFWNSADGTDWLEDFHEASDRYPTAPGRIGSVLLHVNQVIDARSDAEVSEGDTLEVWFHGGPPNLLVGDGPRNLTLEAGNLDRQALFFLQRDAFWLAGPKGNRSEGTTTEEKWSGSSGQAVWAASPRPVLMPMAIEQYYQLVGAANAGVIAAESAGQRQGISTQTMDEIIAEERKSPGVDSYASFSAWPWEPAYGEDAQENA